MSIEPYASSTPERFAFVVVHNDGSFASGAPAAIAFKPPNEGFGAPIPAVLHSEGLPPKRGVYVVATSMASPGVWNSTVTIGGKKLPIAFDVVATPSVPTPGVTAPRAASPTPTNTLAVDPICTREPPCSLHTVSLEQVIGTGRPVAVMFATPARCQTRYCGPVLEQLLTLVGQFQERVQMVHVEIYKDATSNEVVPTVAAWGLPGEPWLFAVDGNGTVVERLDGAFGTDEVHAVLARLAG